MTTCSDFPSEASVMDQRGGDGQIQFRRNFEVHRDQLRDIASALNRMIQNSYFKNKVSLEEQKAQKEDRFLRGRQIALRDP